MRKLIFNLCTPAKEKIKNDLDYMGDDIPKTLKARAVLAYVGATFSDGSECTEKIASQIVSSVDFTKYAPPLLTDHIWESSNVIGTMTDISLNNGIIEATFDVKDKEAIKKITEGLWRSISMTFEQGSYFVQECSIVPIPAIPGAKIEPFNELTTEDPSMIEEADLTNSDNPEDPSMTEEASPLDDANKSQEDALPTENAQKKESVLNAEIFKLKKANSLLRSKIQDMEQTSKAKRTLNTWVKNGLIAPADSGAVFIFMRKLMKHGNGLFEEFKNLITSKSINSASLPSNIGKRLSVPNCSHMTPIDKAKQEQIDYMRNRLERKGMAKNDN